LIERNVSMVIVYLLLGVAIFGLLLWMVSALDQA
jgi:hypothetical protein